MTRIEQDIVSRELASAETFLSGGAVYSAAVRLGGLLASGVSVDALNSVLRRLPVLELEHACAEQEERLERVTATTGALLFEELMLLLTSRIEIAMACLAHNAVTKDRLSSQSSDQEIREIAGRQHELFEIVCVQIRDRWQSDVPFDATRLGIDALMPLLLSSRLLRTLSFLALVREYDALQTAILDAFHREHGDLRATPPTKWPQNGAITAAQRDWAFRRHGHGFTFVAEDWTRVEALEFILKPPYPIDAFRLQLYFETTKLAITDPVNFGNIWDVQAALERLRADAMLTLYPGSGQKVRSYLVSA